ncbi:hypothetical protein BKA62DRAFT_825019 [Auriculariales sp. MPI-PUGE-AT-0066]|nr:hypothetical protein BKA62DRAFT_825019 [Auriculariales sp. MPI-PUGE-AT-0066]
MPAKRRCQFTASEQCNQAALRIVGTCTHCQQHFCGGVSPLVLVLYCADHLLLQHRLPEQHTCHKLEDCRQEAFSRNKARLEAERTVASKMTTT